MPITRQQLVKSMIATGDITKWSEIFDNMAKSTVASAIRANHYRIVKLIDHAEKLTLEEMHALCAYFEISLEELLTLIYNQIGKKKRPVARRRKK